MTRAPKLGLGLAALALATATYAQAPAAADQTLTLQQAMSLASGDQPMVTAFESEAQASEQSAVAARSLPDPQLSVGIQDFPVTGRTAFSPTEDEFTMYTIGIMREQVRRSKREAEAARIQAEALVSHRKASAEERHIRRAIMIAWIDAVEARAKQQLLEREARRGPSPRRAGALDRASSSVEALV